MVLQRRLVCCFALVLVCNASVGDERTTEAVVKAVVQAESKPKATPKNAQEAKDAKNAEEASAVAKATTEVLLSETSTFEAGHSLVPQDIIIQKATENAEKTFKDLTADGVAPKAAADAAADVAVETVDGAANLAMPLQAKVNAEKAAIAAAQAVADHPNNQGAALTEAVSTVKKEEETPGKALQKEKAKGIVAKAKDAVKDMPKMAEDGATAAVEQVSNLSGGSMFFMLIVMVLLFIGVKNFESVRENTPYLKRLKAIREEFHGDGTPADYERGLIQTEYSDFGEMQPMRA